MQGKSTLPLLLGELLKYDYSTNSYVNIWHSPAHAVYTRSAAYRGNTRVSAIYYDDLYSTLPKQMADWKLGLDRFKKPKHHKPSSLIQILIERL